VPHRDDGGDLTSVAVDVVSGVLSRLLETPDIGPESDFFALGGDSLLATRVLSAVARQLGVELTLDDLLRAPTPATLAKTIASQLARPAP
jgi:acyl carrier protein